MPPFPSPYGTAPFKTDFNMRPGRQEHKWCYMDDNVLVQTVLEGLEEMLRRRGNTRAPYYPSFHAAGMMNTEAQSIYPSVYHTMNYPPNFNTEESFVANDVDALAGRMQNAHIAPPPHATDIWSADGGASHGPSSSYDPSAPWVRGYASAPPDAVPDEDMRYTGQHANLVEPSFPSPVLPGPVPSISVIEHLEQGTYPRKQLVKGTPAGPIYFNGGLGVSSGAAASIGVKASIRFELPQFPGHSMQVRVRHGDGKGREGRPITLREMAETVFDELKKLMDHAEKRGDSLRHRGSAVDVERAVLLRVDHISKGSIQPILGIRSNG
ncbi:hypothetical protein LXA43DRAFT_1066760 [Ganoderma leucocontextum]|nr:hypothetical protein LXA43DRAFT_1066760 [Ganoderma leucocontextum]